MANRGVELLSKVRDQCLSRGCGGIKQLAVIFRRMDIDFSKRLTYEELRHGVKEFGLETGEQDLRLLFQTFDRDNNKTIDFVEFMFHLRPPLSMNRVNVISQAFHKLDANNDGEIKLNDLEAVYATNARKHPNYLSGEWTEEDVLRNFLDSMDTPGCPDGKVTKEEFLNYYAGVSATVEDDSYFDLLMRACYDLPQRGTT